MMPGTEVSAQLAVSIFLLEETHGTPSGDFSKASVNLQVAGLSHSLQFPLGGRRMLGSRLGSLIEEVTCYFH